MEMVAVNEPDHLDWETWQMLAVWLTENKEMVGLYEIYKNDAIYTLYLADWYRQHGWTELTEDR